MHAIMKTNIQGNAPRNTNESLVSAVPAISDKKEKPSSLLHYLKKNVAADDATSYHSDALIIWRQYSETRLLDEGEDVLKFWEEKKQCWGSLGDVGCQYLSIPATSTPAERVFSAAGYIVQDRRSRLDPEHVDMLVFLNENFNLLELDKLVKISVQEDEIGQS